MCRLHSTSQRGNFETPGLTFQQSRDFVTTGHTFQQSGNFDTTGITFQQMGNFETPGLTFQQSGDFDTPGITFQQKGNFCTPGATFQQKGNYGFLELVVFWYCLCCTIFAVALLILYDFQLTNKARSATTILIMSMISSIILLRIKDLIIELSHINANEKIITEDKSNDK